MWNEKWRTTICKIFKTQWNVSSIYIVKNNSFLAYKVSFKHTHCTCMSLFVSETFASAKADVCVKLKSWNHPTCQAFWVSQIEVLPSSSFRESPFPLTKLAKPFGFHIYITSYTGFSEELAAGSHVPNPIGFFLNFLVVPWCYKFDSAILHVSNFFVCGLKVAASWTWKDVLKATTTKLHTNVQTGSMVMQYMHLAERWILP